jgi:hypothetical protein
MKLILFFIGIITADKFVSGPIKCMFERTGYYFCGTKNDISVKSPSYEFRSLGYCCKDNEMDPDCNPFGDWCAPKSKFRNNTDAGLMAVYMSYSVGLTLNPAREEFCGGPVTLFANDHTMQTVEFQN